MPLPRVENDLRSKLIVAKERMRMRREAESCLVRLFRQMTYRVRHQIRRAAESSTERLLRRMLHRREQQQKRLAERLSRQMQARESYLENCSQRHLRKNIESHEVKRKSKNDHAKLLTKIQDIKTNQIRRESKSRPVRISQAKVRQDRKCHQTREIENTQERQMKDCASQISSLTNFENDACADETTANYASDSLGVVGMLSDKNRTRETSDSFLTNLAPKPSKQCYKSRRIQQLMDKQTAVAKSAMKPSNEVTFNKKTKRLSLNKSTSAPPSKSRFRKISRKPIMKPPKEVRSGKIDRMQPMVLSTAALPSTPKSSMKPPVEVHFDKNHRIQSMSEPTAPVKSGTESLIEVHVDKNNRIHIMNKPTSALNIKRLPKTQCSQWLHQLRITLTNAIDFHFDKNNTMQSMDKSTAAPQSDSSLTNWAPKPSMQPLVHSDKNQRIQSMDKQTTAAKSVMKSSIEVPFDENNKIQSTAALNTSIRPQIETPSDRSTRTFLLFKSIAPPPSSLDETAITKENEQTRNSSPTQSNFVLLLPKTNDVQSDSGPVAIDVLSAKKGSQANFTKDITKNIATSFVEKTNSSNNNNNSITTVIRNNKTLENKQTNIAENSSPIQPNFVLSLPQTNDVQSDSRPVLIHVLNAKESGPAIFTKDMTEKVVTNFVVKTNSSNNSNNSITTENKKTIAENSSLTQPNFVPSVPQTNDVQSDSKPVLIHVLNAKESGPAIFTKDMTENIVTNFVVKTNSSNNSYNSIMTENEQTNIEENSSPTQSNFVPSLPQTNDVQKDSGPVIIDVMSAKEGGQDIFTKDITENVATNFVEKTNSSNNSNNSITTVIRNKKTLVICLQDEPGVLATQEKSNPNTEKSLAWDSVVQDQSNPKAEKSLARNLVVQDQSNPNTEKSLVEDQSNSSTETSLATNSLAQDQSNPNTEKSLARKSFVQDQSNPSTAKSLAKKSSLARKSLANPLFKDVPKITGGKDTVTSKNLLSIKISFENSLKKMRKYEQEITALMFRLSAEGFIKNHVHWLVQKGFIKSTTVCNACGSKAHFKRNDTYFDGCSWLCEICSRENIFKRPQFYARFPTLRISHMAALIFHWTVQSEVPRILADAPMDISKLCQIWRSFQVLCHSSLRKKNIKLGGEDKIVELCMVLYGKTYILGALERYTINANFRAFPTELNMQQASTIVEILKKWIRPDTFVVMEGTKLFKLPPKYNVIPADTTVTDPSSTKFHCLNVTRNLCGHINKMFGHLKAEDVKIDVIQKYLDELMWRQRFGRNPAKAFHNIMRDIADLETKGKPARPKSRTRNPKRVTAPEQQETTASPTPQEPIIENIDPASLPKVRIVLKQIPDEVLKFYNCFDEMVAHSKSRKAKYVDTNAHNTPNVYQTF